MSSALTEPTPALDADADRAPWSARDTLVGGALTLAPLILLLLPNLFVTATLAKPLSVTADWVSAVITFALSAGLEAVFLIAPFYYARRRGGPDGRRQLGLRPYHIGGIIGLAILGMALVYVLGAGLDALTTALHFTIKTNLDQLIAQARLEPRTTVAAVVASVVAAPICEEIFFRGFLLQGLRRRMPAGWAVALSALIFAAAHVSPGSFPLLFALGLLLGTLRVTTRSLWPGIALHTLNNTIGLIEVALLVAK